MNKLEITKSINRELEIYTDYYESEDKPILIENIEMYLKDIKEHGATHLKFKSYQNTDYDTTTLIFDAVIYQIETDEECIERELKESIKQQQELKKQQEKDLIEYNRLKEKLGNLVL